MVRLRADVPRASVVDAAAALAAERAAGTAGIVEVLTSDTADPTAIAAHVSAPTDVVRL